MWVTFSGMDRNNPPHNIRLCEETQHQLDVGEIFNPDWLAKIREASGIIRFMDWQGTNSNIATLRFSDIADANFCSYGAYTSKPFVKGGMPLRLISSLANQVSSHPWVCIPNVDLAPINFPLSPPSATLILLSLSRLAINGMMVTKSFSMAAIGPRPNEKCSRS